MDVIANSGAVRCGVIAPEDGQAVTFADSYFARHFDEERLRCGLTDTAFGIAAGNVEVSERNVGWTTGGTQVAQHPLRHELGESVWVDRVGWRFFARNLYIRFAKPQPLKRNEVFTPAAWQQLKRLRVELVLLPYFSGSRRLGNNRGRQNA